MTDAARHDGALLPELIDPNNTASDVWADTAYHSEANEKFLAGRLLRSQIHRKKPQGKPMPHRTARANARKSAVRAAVEYVFARQKGPMGLFIRTIGLARDNQNQIRQPAVQYAANGLRSLTRSRKPEQYRLLLNPARDQPCRDITQSLTQLNSRLLSLLKTRFSEAENGIRSSAIRPMPTLSSTASSTMPIASISPATACAGPDREQLQRIDQRSKSQKTTPSRTPLKRATSFRNSGRDDRGMTERHRGISIGMKSVGLHLRRRLRLSHDRGPPQPQPSQSIDCIGCEIIIMLMHGMADHEPRKNKK